MSKNVKKRESEDETRDRTQRNVVTKTIPRTPLITAVARNRDYFRTPARLMQSRCFTTHLEL